MAKETNQDNAQNNTQTENGNNTNAGRIGTSITPMFNQYLDVLRSLSESNNSKTVVLPASTPGGYQDTQSTPIVTSKSGYRVTAVISNTDSSRCSAVLKRFLGSVITASSSHV